MSAYTELHPFGTAELEADHMAESTAAADRSTVLDCYAQLISAYTLALRVGEHVAPMLEHVRKVHALLSQRWAE